MSKIPIKNIYFMLSYAWGYLDEIEMLNLNMDTYQQDIDFMANVLIKGFNYQKKRGLLKGYIEYNEELSLIKGKLNFSDSIKKSSFLRAKASCNYDEFTENILPNQVIKMAFQMLLRSKGMNSDLAQEVRLKIQDLSFVEDIKVFPKDSLKSFLLPRGFNNYKFLLSISEFIILNLSQNDKNGKFEFTDFSRDHMKLAKLYEKFVLNFYKRHLSDSYKVTNTSKEAYEGLNVHAYDARFIPTLNTDIELISKTTNDIIIIDTKFSQETLVSSEYSKEKVHSKYLMQLLTYLENRKRKTGIVPSGMLLYPTVEEHYEFTNKIWDYDVSIFNINLNEDWDLISKNLIKIIIKHKKTVEPIEFKKAA